MADDRTLTPTECDILWTLIDSCGVEHVLGAVLERLTKHSRVAGQMGAPVAQAAAMGKANALTLALTLMKDADDIVELGRKIEAIRRGAAAHNEASLAQLSAQLRVEMERAALAKG